MHAKLLPRLLSAGLIVVPTLVGAQADLGIAGGQSAPTPPRPSFEVASVKPNPSNDRRRFAAQSGGRLVVRNAQLKDLITAAFGMADIQSLIPDRILGGPDWTESERYDIDAKASTEFQFAPDGPPKDMLLMLRSLLEERFKLVRTARPARWGSLRSWSRGRTEGSDRACTSPASTATRWLRVVEPLWRRLHDQASRRHVV